MENKLNHVEFVYPEGKKKALTMSYDDGTEYDRRLVDIFNRHGIKGTFHLNSARLDTPVYVRSDEVAELYRGHEVSAHTYSHPFPERVALPYLTQQIMKDREILEKACGYIVRGMSYPFGTYNDEVVAALPACGIEYSRTVKATHKFNLPENFLKWHPTCHHTDGLMEDGKRFLSDWSWARLMYVWGHSFEFNNNNNWELIEEFCAMMGGRDNIWYATNIEIVDYVNAARRLRFSVCADKVYNPTATDVWIEVNDSNVVKIPAGKTVNLG